MMQAKIKADTITAMKARDQLKVDTLRMLSTAFVNELVATKHKPSEELLDEDAILVIRREVKKRKEAAEAFKGAGRAELAEKEQTEEKILLAYLPAQMSEEDVRKAVEAKKAELGVADKKDMGRLMGAVMKELGGKADGGMVKKAVDSLFL